MQHRIQLRHMINQHENYNKYYTKSTQYCHNKPRRTSDQCKATGWRKMRWTQKRENEQKWKRNGAGLLKTLHRIHKGRHTQVQTHSIPWQTVTQFRVFSLRMAMSMNKKRVWQRIFYIPHFVAKIMKTIGRGPSALKFYKGKWLL